MSYFYENFDDKHRITHDFTNIYKTRGSVFVIDRAMRKAANLTGSLGLRRKKKYSV